MLGRVARINITYNAYDQRLHTHGVGFMTLRPPNNDDFQMADCPVLAK